MRHLATLFLFLCTVSTVSYSAELIQLEGISILGNTEEAKIMTITSWKSAPDMEVPFEHISGHKQDLTNPLHPKRFQLEVDYARKYQTGSASIKTPRKVE